jgi:hypothetical protein
MSDKLNNKDKRVLLLNTLASVREKFDEITLGNSLLEDDVKKAYRCIFNNKDKKPDYGEDLKCDVITSKCGIEALDGFLDEMGSCWLDFFGSDSFSDSKEKKQVFFATICKNRLASSARTKHVEQYNIFLNNKVPVDVFIQLFFVSDRRIKKINRKKLNNVQDKGFYIDYGRASDNPEYGKDIEDNLKCTKQNLLKVLIDILKLEKKEKLYKLDYSQLCNLKNNEERFIKSVCDLNKSLHKKVKYVYFMPIPCPDGSNGLVCFGTKNHLDSEDRSLLNALSFDILYPFVSSYKTAWQRKELQIESIKSAVAALMARNMSHNLGSHPLTNTKNYFRKRIEEVTSSKSKPTRISLGADYRGNVHLLQYIKERMDFIATVVSSDLYPFGALNFKAQLFDVLTEDDHGERHDKKTQNFLLKYLVFSEKLTRYGKDKPDNFNYLWLKVLNETDEYTGRAENEEKEGKIKLALSKMELAVPGGLMGRHAFFCIIENIIRNSAKHSKKDEDLDITIKLNRNDEKRMLDISIYDNRESGKNVRDDIINKHLKQLVILKEENNHIDKNSKGLKEMLICALWLRNENVAEKLFEIQSEKDGEKKINLIKKYLDVSLVGKNGEKKENEGNLCYTIKNVPLFETCHYLEKGKDYEVVEGGIRLVEDKLVTLHADIVAADKDYLFFVKESGKDDVTGMAKGRRLSDIFPRFVDLSKFNKDVKHKWDKAYQSKNGVELFKMYDKASGTELLKAKPTITIESKKYSEQNIEDSFIRVKKGNTDDPDWTILFKNHLDSDAKKQKIVDDNKGNGKYLESESGENFTSTIATFDFLQDPVNRYKVVEAANTRIAIIDERIFGDFQTRWNGDVRLEQKLLEMRGIYLLNFDKENGEEIIDLQGNKFNTNKGEEPKKNIHFVSIHLGLLDKNEKKVNIKKDILDKYFDEKTFVSIHSGRGNFSADLDKELKNYPFISLSALEAAFYDCKYFLTQLFKTTNYYGKGNITDK